jgi:hypothetical protein
MQPAWQALELTVGRKASGFVVAYSVSQLTLTLQLAKEGFKLENLNIFISI